MELDREVLQGRMGQLWYVSLKGGEEGGCGENLRMPPNLSTMATIMYKNPHQAGCLGRVV